MTTAKTDSPGAKPAVSEPTLEQRLNRESGRIRWTELEPHFARGVLLLLEHGTDLIEVAAAMVRDDKPRVSELMKNGQLRLVVSDDAESWLDNKPEFWAVVAAPWVLIQRIDSG